MNQLVIKGITYNSGEEITIIFSTTPVVIHGKIHIQDNNGFYICHNSNTLTGRGSSEMYGYSQSFYLRLEQLNQVMFFHKFDIEPRKNTLALGNDFHRFVNQYDYDLRCLFGLKLGIIDQFDTLTVSDDQGHVRLTSTHSNKSLNIRLGRLIKKLLDIVNKLATANKLNPIGLPYNDEKIEGIHNKWMALHPGSITYKIVNGEEILKGYTSSNYVSGGSSLQKSCMTNKHSYLKLYTSNKQISLLIIYAGEQICGRCLIWKCDDGQTYHDRIYTGYDWVVNRMHEILKKENIKPLTSDNKVTLDAIDFPLYPYMDSFYMVNLKEKILYYDPHNRVRAKHIIRNTSGILAACNTDTQPYPF